MTFNRVLNKQTIVSVLEILQSSRKNELLIHVKSLVKLKCILLFEGSHSEKTVCCDLNYMAF